MSRAAGTVRGLHYQAAPHDEAKLVRCTRGAVFDVLVDLRPGSPTFGRWFGAELSAENARMLYVPRGCAHGYQTLEEDSDMYYMTSAVYAPSAVRGLKFDDPAVGIEWPLPPYRHLGAGSKWPSLQDHLLERELTLMLDTALRRREAEGRPIRVAMIGAGATGRAIALQLGTPVPGIRLAGIANRTPAHAERAFREAGITRWTTADRRGVAADAIRRGVPVLTDDAVAARPISRDRPGRSR